MERFIKNIILFSIPIFLIGACVIPFYLAGYNTGEFSDIDEAIKSQREDHNILLGLGYNEQTPYYKLMNADYYQADIIALGTSRALQYKSVYFKGDFYNCGGAVAGNYDEYKNFLENLSYTPDMILLDLDAWVFNDAWNQSCRDYDDHVDITMIQRDMGPMLKQVIKDWSAGRWKASDLDLYADNIGFNGKIRDSGFMYDGSYYYGDIYRYPEIQQDYQFKDTRDRIKKGDRRFEHGDHVDPDTVDRLDGLLRYCSHNDIYVIGYIAPFAPSIYKEMIESGAYGYLDEIDAESRKIFERYGFELYDHASGDIPDVIDGYFIDGFHGSEVAHALMVRDMLRHGSEIKVYIDEKKLDSLIRDAYSGSVFERPDKRIIR